MIKIGIMALLTEKTFINITNLYIKIYMNDRLAVIMNCSLDIVALPVASMVSAKLLYLLFRCLSLLVI